MKILEHVVSLLSCDSTSILFGIMLQIVLATERFILVCTPYRDLAHGGINNLSGGKDGLRPVLTDWAKRLIFFYRVGIGDKFKKLPEGLPLSVSIEAHTDDLLFHDLYREENKVAKIRKELGLFNNHALRVMIT
jgi:hypothetical protein